MELEGEEEEAEEEEEEGEEQGLGAERVCARARVKGGGSFPVPSRSALSFALLQSSSQTSVCAPACVSIASNPKGTKGLLAGQDFSF